jgi:RNA polymerase-binding transcription factor DksA
MNILSTGVTRERRAPTTQRLIQQRKRLLRARAALSQRIKRLAEEALEDTPGYSVHMADAGTDSFDRDLALGLVSFEQEALYEVEAALKRIDDGTYGVCELTGRLIPWRRLQAVPWTRFSIEAEAKVEAGLRAHIGPLRSVRFTSEESFETPIDPEREDAIDRSNEETKAHMAGTKNSS